MLLAEYQPGGRGPHCFDCFGWYRAILARQGVEIPDQPSPADPGARAAAIDMSIAWEWEALDQPIPGAAVLLRIAGFGAHLGVVLDGGEHFAHMSRNGVTIARIDDPRWAGRILGYYRHA